MGHMNENQYGDSDFHHRLSLMFSPVMTLF